MKHHPAECNRADTVFDVCLASLLCGIGVLMLYLAAYSAKYGLASLFSWAS